MKAKKTKSPYGRARMGRPPKPASEKQSACVMVRLTPGEYRRLLAEAKRAGMPTATYVLNCWKNRRRKFDSPAEKILPERGEK